VPAFNSFPTELLGWTVPPPLPQVDFSSEMVILAHAGEKPTRGYCIAVEAATGNRRDATVTVVTSGPPPGSLLPVVTQPFDLVRLPRRDDVTFEEKSETRQCGTLGA
jgi:hypothetical protein